MSKKEKRKKWSKLWTISVVVLLAFAFRYLYQDTTPGPLETLVFSGNTMATMYQVKVVGREFDPAVSKTLARKIEAKLEFVNTQMSRYHKGGDIYRLNQAVAHTPVSMSPEVITVLKKAKEISVLTHGAFDVTVGPLIQLWGFHDKKSLEKRPSSDDIKKVRSQIGYSHLRIDSAANTVTKDIDGLDVDLSAIAKGRAVDLVAKVLEDSNQHDYMVEVGGEIRCKGNNDQGAHWKIGIEKPVGGSISHREVAHVVSLDNSSLATSGDYRSFYMLAGKRVSHTVNPKTGKPIEHQLASVSVVSSDCMTADALATGLTVMGAIDGKKLADKLGFAAYFIQRKQDGFVSTASKMFYKRHGKTKAK